MKRPEILLLVGFMLITMGLILLASAGLESAEGFVFIFPFLFVGNLGLPISVIILGMMVFITFMLFRFFTGLMPEEILQERDQRTPAYMKVGSICPNCNSPVPERATFCSACGFPIDAQSENDRRDI